MSELKIGCMMLGSGMTNGYFIHREGESDCIFIDPGAKGDRVYEQLKGQGLNVRFILLTHGHYDHILGLRALKEACGAPVYAHRDEEKTLEDPNLNLSIYTGEVCSASADRYLDDGEELSLCGMDIRVLHTPGHTPGGCCFYFYEDGVLISGDTLFEESVGRTDFPGGSMSTLINGIRTKLMVLPEETKVYPGHGGSTTIGMEKEYNPFLA